MYALEGRNAFQQYLERWGERECLSFGRYENTLQLSGNGCNVCNLQEIKKNDKHTCSAARYGTSAPCHPGVTRGCYLMGHILTCSDVLSD